jgi:hypothetical protein
MRLAASEAGVDRRHAVEGDFLADKYGRMRFRRLDTMGRYVDDPNEEVEPGVEYYAPGPIETEYIEAQTRK